MYSGRLPVLHPSFVFSVLSISCCCFFLFLNVVLPWVLPASKTKPANQPINHTAKQTNNKRGSSSTEKAYPFSFFSFFPFCRSRNTSFSQSKWTVTFHSCFKHDKSPDTQTHMPHWKHYVSLEPFLSKHLQMGEIWCVPGAGVVWDTDPSHYFFISQEHRQSQSPCAGFVPLR